VSGTRTSISGGFRNIASGSIAGVSGGRGSTASGRQASVSGGHLNIANGPKEVRSHAWDLEMLFLITTKGKNHVQR